jgi:hypothetical protein
VGRTTTAGARVRVFLAGECGRRGKRGLGFLGGGTGVLVGELVGGEHLGARRAARGRHAGASRTEVGDDFGDFAISPLRWSWAKLGCWWVGLLGCAEEEGREESWAAAQLGERGSLLFF